MQIENHSVLMDRFQSPSIQATSTRNILSNPSESQAHITDLSWLDRDLDLNNENQNSLQVKIIQLYQAIQKKTIKNMEVKKNNEVLKGQVQAYISIIEKIQKASYSSSTSTQLQNIPTIETRSSRETVLNLEQNQDSHNVNEYHFVNQTFQHDQQTGLIDPMNGQKNYELERSIFQNEHRNSENKSQNSTPINSIINLRVEKEVEQHSSKDFRNKGKYQQGYQALNYNQSYCNNEYQRIQRKNSGGRMPTNYNRTFECSMAINNLDCPPPRPSIDMEVKKFTSPNKSFLKKGSIQNMSSGNIVSKYSNIDIQSLWNESKSPNNRYGAEDRIRSPKRPTKIQINTFKEDGNNQRVKMCKKVSKFA